jgi:AAA+ superfamily predicted ATPase
MIHGTEPDIGRWGPSVNEQLQSKSLVAVRSMMDAGRPLIYLQSVEEDRVIGLLSQLAREQRDGKTDLLIWSVTDGLQLNGRAYKNQPAGPREMLDFIIAFDKPAVFLLKDFHEFIAGAPEIRRRLRDVYYQCLDGGKFAVIASPVKCIPDEISREVAFLNLPRPDLAELEELLRAEAATIGGEAAVRSKEDVYTLGRALQGLTFNEARHVIRRAVAEKSRLDASAVPLFQEEKRLLVRKAGLIEYVPDTVGIEQVGGVDTMKHWLVQRRKLFFSRESISHEIVPKGVLLMGVSGCGKSLSARAIAHAFDLPLYRVAMVEVFSAGMGNAERLFAEACRAMEEVSPAVVWFDEIENSLSRHYHETSGTLDRLFAYFLTWMQEKPAGLFVAATANRIDLLPAEMIRKGRFDQVFFLDLPDKQDRLEIFDIHLRKRGIDPATLSMDLIGERTDGWTGAEIEQCVISALIAAQLAGQPCSDKFMLPALREIVPLSRTMKEQVSQIRSWAFDRAIRASAKR